MLVRRVIVVGGSAVAISYNSSTIALSLWPRLWGAGWAAAQSRRETSGEDEFSELLGGGSTPLGSIRLPCWMGFELFASAPPRQLNLHSLTQDLAMLGSAPRRSEPQTPTLSASHPHRALGRRQGELLGLDSLKAKRKADI